jgi:hypothetical protein
MGDEASGKQLYPDPISTSLVASHSFTSVARLTRLFQEKLHIFLASPGKSRKLYMRTNSSGISGI